MSNLLKNEMDLEKIEEMLKLIRPEPGTDFHQRMAVMPWTKDVRFPLRTLKTHPVPMVALAILALITGFILATPSGNAIAKQVMQFITRSEGDVLPLSTEYISIPQPTLTPEPSFGLALVPIEAGDFVTTAPTLPVPQGIPLAEAETLAGFDLFEPSQLPRDYGLTKVEFNEESQTVRMEFKSPQAGSGEFFAITQGRELEPIEVGASAKVENILIGNSTAEFVQGGWFTSIGGNTATWTGSGAPHVLRWEANGITIEMLFMLNDTFFPAYITRDEMIALAEGLVQCPSSNSGACDGDRVIVSHLPVPTNNDKNWMEAYRSVAEVEALSKFDILVPGLLPQGMPFSHVRYNPNLKMVWLEFGHWANDLLHSNGPTLRIMQSEQIGQEETYTELYPPEAIQEIKINGYAGKLYIGELIWPEAAAGEPTPTPIWDADSGRVWVTWTVEAIRYSISFFPSTMGGERLSPQNLLFIAESMR